MRTLRSVIILPPRQPHFLAWLPRWQLVRTGHFLTKTMVVKCLKSLLLSNILARNNSEAMFYHEHRQNTEIADGKMNSHSLGVRENNYIYPKWPTMLNKTRNPSAFLKLDTTSDWLYLHTQIYVHESISSAIFSMPHGQRSKCHHKNHRLFVVHRQRKLLNIKSLVACGSPSAFQGFPILLCVFPGPSLHRNYLIFCEIIKQRDNYNKQVVWELISTQWKKVL